MRAPCGDGLPALNRAAGHHIGDAQPGGDQQKQPPPAHEEVTGGQQHTGDARQLGVHLGKDIVEGRDGHGDDDNKHDDGHHNDHGGVGQGADHLGLGLGGFIIVPVQPLEALLQRAGLFSGPDRLNEGLGQIGGVVFKALGHGVACAHLLGHLLQHLADVTVPGLGRHHLHTVLNGHTCGEDNGELGADQGQLLFLDLQADGAVEDVFLLLPHLLQPGDNGYGLPQAAGGPRTRHRPG